MEVLNDGSLISGYWLGFLFADGHFQENNRIVVGLSTKDIDHLQKLVEYTETGRIRTYKKNKYETCWWAVMNQKVVGEIRTKYSILSNKTEYPPDLSSLCGEFKKAFAVGFIDGDGSIGYQSGRQDCILRIKCHSSWKDNLEFIYERPTSINAEGYATLNISDNEILREYKRFVLDKNLPVLERKWDKINVDVESRYVGSKKRIENILYLKSLGMRNTDIAYQLSVTDPYVHTVLKGNYDK